MSNAMYIQENFYDSSRRLRHREFSYFGVEMERPAFNALVGSYRGQAITTEGTALAELQLEIREREIIEGSPFEEETATLRILGLPGNGAVRFPPMLVIGGHSNNFYAVAGGTPSNTNPFAYELEFAAFEGNQIAGYFGRFHAIRPGVEPLIGVEHGDPSEDLQGVFGVTPDP